MAIAPPVSPRAPVEVERDVFLGAAAIDQRIPVWHRALVAAKPSRFVLFGLATLLLFFGLTTYVAKENAEAALLSYRVHLDEVRQALTRVDPEEAHRGLVRAAGDLRAARTSRGALGVRAIGALPGLERAIASYDAFLVAADELYVSAERASEVVDLVKGTGSGPKLLAEGRINFDVLKRARLETLEGLAALDRARVAVEKVESFPLFDGIARAKREAAEQIAKAQADSRYVPALLDALPAILGAKGPRAYFFAIQNSAELRGSGGGLLSFVLVRVDGGKIEIDSGGTVYKLETEDPNARQVFAFDWKEDDFWTVAIPDTRRIGNANWSPHFPTVGHNVAELYRIQSGGETVDGVIAVTPEFLARALRVTGPVAVEGVDAPLTADTVVAFLVHDAYRLYDQEIRRAINATLIKVVADHLLSGSDIGGLLRELGGAVPSRALQVYVVRPEEQDVVAAAGLHGGLADTLHDYGSLVVNNAAGNKADFYVRHEVRQDVRLQSDGTAEERVIHTVVNEAPPQEGRLPEYLDGYADRFLAAYLPGRAQAVSHESDVAVQLGAVIPPLNREAGKIAVVQAVRVVPEARGTFAVRYSLPNAASIGEDGVWTYMLVRQRQPRLDPEIITVAVALPAGARAVDPLGWSLDNQGFWVAKVEVTGTQTFTLRYRL